MSTDYDIGGWRSGRGPVRGRLRRTCSRWIWPVRWVITSTLTSGPIRSGSRLTGPAPKVRPVVWHDLLASRDPTIVAGYASIAQLIDFVAEWSTRSSKGAGPRGAVRVLLGAEPYPTVRRNFSSSTGVFSEEVQRYWLEERGISLNQSARIVQVLEAIDAGRLVARFLHGTSRLHAKIYVGSGAATLGSSNFTAAGLSDQVEVNARFDAEQDRRRYEELVAISANLWSAATDWTAELAPLSERVTACILGIPGSPSAGPSLATPLGDASR